MKMKRSLSILLALLVLLGCMPWQSVSAVGQEAEKIEPSQTENFKQEIEQSEVLSSIEMLALECEQSGLFRYIDEGSFRQAEHTLRLTEEENLNTYVFQNKDGTKSVYYLDQDVKYVAANGDIRDKDITLISKANGYGMRDNNVDVLLPNRAVDGIAVTYGGSFIRLIPQGGAGEAQLRDNAVVYDNFYGEGTALKYSPMLSGVKEDIILDAYTGMSSFAFILYTDGLNLYEEAGQYYLAENEAAEAVFYLGQVVVYDAVGCPSMGGMDVETLEEGEVYQLTIHADVAFLTAPTTVYPVTIDPTITITDSATGGVIEDAPVFSGYPNTNFGNYVFNTIGYTDANYGIGRTVVRLNGLLENEMFNALSASNIDRVEFYMKDGGSSSAVVNIHGLTGNSTWTESAVKWSDVTLLHTTQIYASATMGGGAWTTFNITTLAKQWKAGTQNGQCGFIMIGAQEETKKIGALSCEYGTGDYWPYVVVTYTPVISINCDSAEVKVNYGTQLTATTMPAGMAITWRSSNDTIASVSSDGVVYAYKAGMVTVTASVTDEDGKTHTDTCTVYVYLADGVYRIQNGFSRHYVGVQNGAIGDQTIVTQQNICNKNTAELQYYAQLWKVEYLGSGYYSFRPMHRLSSALCAVSSGVMIRDIGTDDSIVPAGAKWTIQYYLTGYVIRCEGNSNQSLMPIGSSTATDMPITATSFVNAKSAFRWEFISVTGIGDTLLLIDTVNNTTLSEATRYVAPGETRTLEDMGLAVSFVSAGTNNQSIGLSAINSTISVNQTGKSIAGITKDSTSMLIISYQRNGTLHTKSVNITVLSIPEGTYFIRNKYSEKYVDVQNGAMQIGATIHQWSFTGENSQKWTFTNLGDGTYSISLLVNETQYYLGVNGDSTENNQSIVLRTGIITDGMRWTISRTEKGYYKLTPNSGKLNGRVLSLRWASDDADDGGLIYQMNYENEHDDRADWFLQPLYSVQLNTPQIRQTEEVWCWVAAAQMLARTLWPNDSNIDPSAATIEQRNAVYYVNGDSSLSTPEDYNWAEDNQKLKLKDGIFTDVCDAAKYFTNIAGGDTSFVGCISTISEEHLVHYLMDGYPVVMLLGRFKDNNGDGRLSAGEWADYLIDGNYQGHVVVFTGLVWDDESKCYTFIINDPNEENPLYGTYSYWLEHADESDGNYIYKWVPSVVVDTAYFEDACNSSFGNIIYRPEA